MDAFFWAALGFLVVASFAGAAFVGVRAWRLWQAFVSFAAGAGGGLDRLADAAERLSRHADATTRRGEELADAIERLHASQRRLHILRSAAAEVTDTVRAAFLFAPQK